MDDEATQPSTQQVLDPRRLGRNNSGLSEPDISDVLCILHPGSPAAFRVVKLAAERSPQHVLQNEALRPSIFESQVSNVEEQETFILSVGQHPESAVTDLALRFSSRTVNPVMGFTFGRNPKVCDIVFDVDSIKRVSNLHFRIYVNDAGVVMLQDMSTNGTLVDGYLLKGKAQQAPATRMLNPGSIIQIISPNANELIKFILRIPSRDGHIDEYSAKFLGYMERVTMLEKQQRGDHEILARGRRGHLPQAALPLAGVTANAAVPLKAPIITSNNTHGMKWDGGEEYNVTGRLGRGAFAMVYRLATAMDGRELAAKELEKKRFIKNGQLDQKVDNEMRIMKTLSHPNIVKYEDYRDEKTHLYIIMEYVPGGDLQEYLTIPESRVLPEKAAKQVAAQILDALAYLHHKKITHRDIKPDNILIASEDPFVVKLSDFGLSKVVTNNETFLKTFCGTLLYCAPEVFPQYDSNASRKGTKRRRGAGAKSGYHAYSQSIDIWSFAAVLWFAMCGIPPFEGVVDTTGQGMFEKIMSTRLNPQVLFDKGVSPQAVDLLLKMLNTDPSQRPTELECLQHPWLADVVTQHPSYAQSVLKAIAEEAEDPIEAENEPAVQLSQLSIHGDRKVQSDLQVNARDFIDDSDSRGATNMDVRQSKRVRPDLLTPRNQIREQAGTDSSPEVSFRTSLIGEGEDGLTPSVRGAGQGRLFGEIGQSALRSSGVLGQHTQLALAIADEQDKDELENGTQHHYSTAPEFKREIDVAYPTLPPEDATAGAERHGPDAASSLLGAESMMREITMGDSPQSANSPANEPPTPKTPDFSQASTGAAPGGVQDITPKAQVTTSFDRKIRLSQPSFYDGESSSDGSFGDSKRSTAEDFVAPDLPPSLATGLPATMLHPSLPGPPTSLDGTGDESDTQAGASRAPYKDGTLDKTPSPTEGEFRRPAPRLGKLTSTAASTGFKELPIILRLEQRVTTWGREPSNTHVFPDPLNVHVPKRGIVIYFHAVGIEQAESDGMDITKMKGLHTLITTGSKVGVWVNGVRLKADDLAAGGGGGGKTNYGKLYTGDVITVFRDPAEGGARLELECEFYHGEATKRRPEVEPFRVLKG